jgi:hypothetical protein
MEDKSDWRIFLQLFREERVWVIIFDLWVKMDSRMSFSKHIDVHVGKALEMLGFVG